MAVYYVDTSALVKYYVRERGTAWVRDLFDPARAHTLYTVSLTGAELVAAVHRKGRTGELDAASVTRTTAAVRTDWPTWAHVLTIHAGLIEGAMDLIERHGLRGYDAVHLAAALEVGRAQRQGKADPLTFVSADTDQRQAATSEGLTVADPNAHP